MNGKLSAIDLFSGSGGTSFALSDYVEPIIYCDIERFPQGILISRMDDGLIPFAPIWNDVRTMDGRKFRGLANILLSTFPCQDISSAGKGAGLAGERSGLFYESIRIAKEAEVEFIFLENVPAIRTRGGLEVQEELSRIGFYSRWGHLSAAEIGAVHERDRWFCLATRKDVADADSTELRIEPGRSSWADGQGSIFAGDNGKEGNVTYSVSVRTQIQIDGKFAAIELLGGPGKDWPTIERGWPTESPVCRTDDAPAFRVDRIKAVGNGVDAIQAKTAFEILMGIRA